MLSSHVSYCVTNYKLSFNLVNGDLKVLTKKLKGNDIHQLLN